MISAFLYIPDSPPPVAGRSIDFHLPAFIMAGPRVTEVSLSPKLSLRRQVPPVFFAVTRLPDECVAAVRFGIVEVSEYSVFKVHSHEDAFNNKKPLKTENLACLIICL